MMTRRDALGAFAAGLLTRAQAAEPDWPQFRGPRRDGKSTETGLLQRWPENGPKLLWQTEGIGNGFGTVAISGPRIYVQGGVDKRSSVLCLNRADGKIVWTKPIGAVGANDRGDGPRSTPTVDADVAYIMTEEGDLACLKTADGSIVWQKSAMKDFGGRNPHWLYSESPLIDGDRLYITPGASAASMVSLDKKTGKWQWSSSDLTDSCGYSSAIVAPIGSVKTIINFTARAGVGVRASDGKPLWQWTRPANRTANCTMPIFENNRVFYTSAYGTGGGVLELTPKGDGVEEKELWFNGEMMNHHGGVVLLNGYLYGFSNAILTCMEFATGKALWKDRSVGKGSVTYADGKLYLLSESNVMGIADATPEGYSERGRFRFPDQGKPSWAYPVVCGGRLYIRDQGVLRCYDIRA